MSKIAKEQTSERSVHVVTHTHWDREWYAPFEIFKGRLVQLMDELLERINDKPYFEHFMMDGQTVALEDYLEERPSRREKLVDLIKKGKIIVGPWYILPDEFLVTGEAMIRNFLVGQEVLKDLGVPSMKIGYLPDMFGHNAYTPTLLKGLELKAAVIWRGIGDECRETEFIWESPSGDKIPTVSLLHGYSNGAHFGRSISEMEEAFSKEVEFLTQHRTTSNVLIMNGTDHEFPLYDLPEKFPEWSEKLGVKFIHSTLEKYIDDVLKEKPHLKKVKGELRDPKYAPTLKDITSTRIYLKTLNFDAQQLFLRYVEPLSAFLFLSGEKVDTEEIENGWKLILKSQPHDSICGCSVDAVHQEVETRLRRAIEHGASLVAKYMRKIANKVNIQEEKGMPILVFNPYEHERSSVISIFALENENKRFEIIDEEGKKYTPDVETLSEDERENVINWSKLENKLDFLSGISKFQTALSPLRVFYNFKIENGPVLENKKIVQIVFYAKLPPLGFKKFYLKEKNEEPSKSKSVLDPDFENDLYSFHLNEDGSFDLMDKTNNVKFQAMNHFEDVADAGDEYNFSPIDDIPITTLNSRAEILSTVENDFLKKVKIRLKMKIPRSLNDKRDSRSMEKEEMQLFVTYKIHKEVPRVDVNLTLDNPALDHKTTFVVNIPERLQEVENDGYFGLVTHPSDKRIDGEVYSEEDISRYAMESFAIFKGEKSKLLVTTRGIHEYESHVTGNGTKVNFTVLRSVGWLSRGDISTRRGNAGPELSTPEAQCLRKHEYQYSFAFLKKGDDTEAYNTSRDFLTPPVGIILEKPKNEYTNGIKIPYLSLDEEFTLFAFKISQDKKKTILRILNTSSKEKTLSVPFHCQPENLTEQPLKGSCALPPHGLATFSLQKEDRE